MITYACAAVSRVAASKWILQRKNVRKYRFLVTECFERKLEATAGLIITPNSNVFESVRMLSGGRDQ